MLHARNRGKIVIIDDSAIVVEAMQIALEKIGYAVVSRTVALGTGALILREMPDLVLMDVSMPTLDGVDVVQRMRKNERLKKIPVLLFSSKTEEELQAAVARSGADGYLCKSSDHDEVARLVHGWVRRLVPSRF